MSLAERELHEDCSGAGRGNFSATDRIQRLKNRYLDAKPTLCPERSLLYNEYWQKSHGEHVLLRRANAFRHVLNNITLRLGADELIVGSQTKYVRGGPLYPEFGSDWLLKEIDSMPDRETQAFTFTPETREMVLEAARYWQDKSVHDLARKLWEGHYGNRIEEAVEAGLFTEFSRWPQGRMSLNYEKVLKKGLLGIIDEARDVARDLNASNDVKYFEKKYFLDAVMVSCQAVIEFANRYADLAAELAAKENDAKRKIELEQIAANCRRVPAHPAGSFHEALQSLWFVHLSVEIENCSAGYSPGRFDQYMLPFYREDIAKGNLTRDEAGELLACLFIKFTEIERVKDLRFSQQGHSNYQNLTIAGQTVNGRDATNELSFLILDVTEATKVTQPTISIRYFDGLDDEFLLRAAEVVRSGGGMPAFFNDKAALASLPLYGISLEEARNYVPIGCVERALPHCSILTLHHGFLNLPKCLEMALNNGTDPVSGKQLGPETGDASSFRNIEELQDAFMTQVRSAMELMVCPGNVSYSLHSTFTPVPFNSCLMDDCIPRATDISAGGLRYNNFVSAFPSGIVNTANSLTAIKQLVFDDQEVSMTELLAALQADFEGHGLLHQKLLEAPKYANDLEEPDNMVAKVYELMIDLVPQYNNPFGHPNTPAFAGITVHYFFGDKVGALADGRKAFIPLADGTLSPFIGTDNSGPTAVIKSAAKVDAVKAFSTLLNMKFHPRSLSNREQLMKFIILIKTYFDLYGHHIQFNVVSKETLLKAKEHPEEYRDLVVRVAGFSVFWVDLAPDIQDEIIARTEHDF